MDSFEIFYEKFSLNPKNWFQSPEVKRKLREQEIAMRANDRRHARENIKKLKDLLKSKGYLIYRSDIGSYSARKSRMIGLSDQDITYDKRKYTGSLSLAYIRALFTLAHEVGHALQWDDGTDKEERFDEFHDQVLNAKNDDPEQVKYILDLQKIWYELDAWDKGMEFIPIELKPQYKKYAYNNYQTYMDRLPRYYRTDIMLRNLLHKLNFEEQ